MVLDFLIMEACLCCNAQKKNQRLVGLIISQRPDIPKHIEPSQVNVIPRTSIFDVSLARRRYAQCVASLHRSETVDQVN